MPRLRVLALVFVASLLIWLVIALPAAPFVQRLDGTQVAGAPLSVHQVSGTVWSGRLGGRWRDWRGGLLWRLSRDGWRPALQVELRGDDFLVSGRFAGGRETLRVHDLELNIPLQPFTRQLEQGSAEGRVQGRIDSLRWRQAGAVEAQGSLRYSGGRVTWPPDGGADVPALDGDLFSEEQRARLVVTAPDGQRVMDASLGGEEAEIRVFRAWPRLLGVSQGGRDEDVVFQVRERLLR